MSDLLNSLHRDHVNALRLLALLEQCAGALAEGGSSDLRLMHDVMRYMVSYADSIHHPHEDLILRKLMAKKEQARAAVEPVLEDHVQLADLSRNLRDTLYGAVEGSVTSIERIAQLVRQYVQRLRSHMDLEEAQIFPKALELLDEKDWAEIEGSWKTVEDPVFGQAVAESYRQLYESLYRRSSS